MTWQFDTCLKIARLAKTLLPHAKIAVGGYHATLMVEAIDAAGEGRWIDFLVVGEGEETFRRLVNALEGQSSLDAIPSLAYRRADGRFVANPRGELLDLTRLKLPIRDHRRLTGGYHMMASRIEVIETSRGCTRNCNFCSIRHMYGRSYRAFPTERVIADIDDIYYRRGTRQVFVVDDNLVLDPPRVMQLCEAIIRRGYRRLGFTVQADSISIARNPEMVTLMARAGFKAVYLGIESASARNLALMNKGNIVEDTRRAVQLCHANQMMVIGGLIFGLPDDDEEAVIANYRFLKALDADAAYCQILTPYPKTGIRRDLLAAGLVTNADDFRWYNGQWANIRTHHLEAEQLQFFFWYHRQKVLGWWDPSRRARSMGRGWTGVWIYLMKPLLQFVMRRRVRKFGWKQRFLREMRRLVRINNFTDLV